MYFSLRYAVIVLLSFFLDRLVVAFLMLQVSLVGSGGVCVEVVAFFFASVCCSKSLF